MDLEKDLLIIDILEDIVLHLESESGCECSDQWTKIDLLEQQVKGETYGI